MAPFVLAFDLGTGGCKAALYDVDGSCAAEAFRAYETRFPAGGMHEQRPQDWWDAVVATAREVRGRARVAARDVSAVACSGQSLAVVPLDERGKLLTELCPIWSDARAAEQAARFFERVDEAAWYMATGNGFPPQLYSAFKVMWLRDTRPDVFARTHVVAGSKDWVNLRLTGRLVTDHSYASGSGVYSLADGDYDDGLLEGCGLRRSVLPAIVPATEVVSGLLPAAAEALGLAEGTQVMAGGVDNSCMAVGAHNFDDGELYASLGSSSWITVTSREPVLDEGARPFVFASVVPGRFHSAVSTFGAGTTLAWVRRTLLPEAEDDIALLSLAAQSPPGARSLLFVPTLAGGTSLEGGPDVRGAYLGLDVAHTGADLARAAVEGVAFALRRALDALRRLVPVAGELLVVGGASKSDFVRQLYANVLGVRVIKTSVDQQAATLGAAAVALVGSGAWSDFSRVRDVHTVLHSYDPDPVAARRYDELLEAFTAGARWQTELAGLLRAPVG